jgi:hypothetical protein
MALQVTVEGAAGTVTETTQQQSVVIDSPSVAVGFAVREPLAVEVQGGGVAVAVLAPGYSQQLVGAQYLNDLLDVEAMPSDGSLLQYDESGSRWIAGCRLIFRPLLKAYMISGG